MKNKQKHHNKIVMYDEVTGLRWWITTKGKVYPTNWRLQSSMYASMARNEEVKRKLYGNKNG